MEGYHILILSSLGQCYSEWVLLPSLSPNQNKFESQFSHRNGYEIPLKNVTDGNTKFCPDFHNLTTMSYGTLFKEEIESRTSNGWEISMEDVEELIKEGEKVPKTSGEKASLVKQMGENLMTEAEKKIKALFSQSRESRTTKDFHHHSMESALLTISMLLFGVYLSKLIVKLLLSHYNRFNGGITMMTGIRGPVALTHGRRRRRRTTQLQEINIMRLIDKYNSRFN